MNAVADLTTPTVAPRSRMALGCLAIAGIAAYHLALIGPFAVILMLNPWVHYYGVWPVVGVLLFIWWTLQPNHVTPGIPVARTEAPALCIVRSRRLSSESGGSSHTGPVTIWPRSAVV